MPELGNERKAFYRHVIPSVNASSVPLDIFDPLCPSKMLTEIRPICSNLGPWITVTMINWTDEKKKMSLELSRNVLASVSGSNFLVSEFFSQKILGIYKSGDVINLGEIAPHTSRLLRIAPWDGVNPVLAGTDMHFSGGGAEIISWNTLNNQIKGEIGTRWKYPVKISVAFPDEKESGYTHKIVVVNPGQRLFYMDFPE